MKYARPLLITFSVVIAVSVAVAVAAAVAIAVAILNGLTVYKTDSIDPVIASSTYIRNKAANAVDEIVDIHDNEISKVVTNNTNVLAMSEFVDRKISVDKDAVEKNIGFYFY